MLQYSELYEKLFSSHSKLIKLLGIKQHDQASSCEMLHGDAYHVKTFAVGVVQSGNRSTLTTGTVTIKNVL